MMTKIYDLAFEIEGDEINLEQDVGCGEVHQVTLHRIHLRLLAEKSGLCPSADIEANRMIARLCRQVRLLAERIDRLDTMFLRVGEKGHEDVSEECAYSGASVELANEFCHDLPDVEPVTLGHQCQPVTRDPASRDDGQPSTEPTTLENNAVSASSQAALPLEVQP